MVARVGPERYDRPYRKRPDLDTIEEFEILLATSPRRSMNPFWSEVIDIWSGTVDWPAAEDQNWNSGGEAAGFGDDFKANAGAQPGGFENGFDNFTNGNQGGNDSFGGEQNGNAGNGDNGDNTCHYCHAGASTLSFGSPLLMLSTEGHIARDV